MLATKYRPKNFDELVGQDALRKSLIYALDNNRVAQAFLFSGLRGSGKTTSARILARCLNCQNGISAHPCGTCANCQGLSDVYELDAASNRGIDAINELIESTKYAPLSSRFKIYIIDEVHMLTKEAFNALLKTLEEPPHYVKFILATTDANKLPATILSRVLHFRFSKIARSLVVDRLRQILQLEGIKYEDEALNLIARAGFGSMRDSLTLLDQALIFCEQNINTQQVRIMLNLFGGSEVKDFLQALANADENRVLSFLQLAKNYEASVVLDEIKSTLKESFYANEGLFDLATFQRFFEILASSYSLLKSCDDDEFALGVCILSLKEAVFAISKSTAAEPEQNEAQSLFNELLSKSSARDPEFGNLLYECMKLEALDDEFIALSINPKTIEQVQQFKQAYALWWRDFAKSITHRALKLSSQSGPALSAAAAPSPTAMPTAKRTSAAQTPEASVGTNAAISNAAAAPSPTAMPTAKRTSAAQTPEASVGLHKNINEPELPSYQIDEFDGVIDDEYEDESDLAQSEQAYLNMSEESVELIMSYTDVELSAQSVIVWVMCPQEPELSKLRYATLEYVKNLGEIYHLPVEVKKKLL